MTLPRKFAEQIAPWVLMIVLATVWWGGARLVRWSGLSGLLPSAPAVAHVGPRSDAPSSVPPPVAVRDPLPAAATRGDADEDAGDELLSAGGLPVITFHDITNLRHRALTVPVEGTSPAALVPSYRDTRDGERRHEAMDILADRGTPVVAVEDGRIAKLFDSKNGGLTIYQIDPAEQFAYYYAHLDRYAAALGEGDRVHRGQTIGYVGTTGNAPPGTPHLHFAIFKLGPDRKWWEGTPLDPYVVWR
ncbi:MAG: peptidoglycan DD-metalloendopeptidase family protein [Acidobacteria bacterium]|nr:peptidoglycan DD-metalloendopeptidase family protein [Acidobacteriota bacterium]